MTSGATFIWPRAITIPPPPHFIPTLDCSPAPSRLCKFQGMGKLVVAPFQLHERLLQLIEREIENARRGLPARIIAKINSLADRQTIEALYRASEAGGEVDF